MKEIEEMKNIRFNITNKLSTTMLELLLTEQMIKNVKLTKEEFVLLHKHFEDLKEDYSKEFMNSNKEQIKRYNELHKKISEK